MSLRGNLVAPAYDRMTRKGEEAGLGAMSESLLSDAKGRVLEIGGGTGSNLRYYGELDSLVVTEPEPPMLKRLQRRAQEEESHATILGAPAEDIPFGDDSFDTAVSTPVLCGVDDQQRALR